MEDIRVEIIINSSVDLGGGRIIEQKKIFKWIYSEDT